MKAMAEEAEKLATVRIAETIEQTRTDLFDRFTETAFDAKLVNMRSEQRAERAAAADLPEHEQAALRARQRSHLFPISGLVALLRKARAQRSQALAGMKALAMLRPAYWADIYGRVLSTAFWLVARTPLNWKPPKVQPQPDPFDPSTYRAAADDIAPLARPKAKPRTSAVLMPAAPVRTPPRL